MKSLTPSSVILDVDGDLNVYVTYSMKSSSKHRIPPPTSAHSTAPGRPVAITIVIFITIIIIIIIATTTTTTTNDNVNIIIIIVIIIIIGDRRSKRPLFPRRRLCQEGTGPVRFVSVPDFSKIHRFGSVRFGQTSFPVRRGSAGVFGTRRGSVRFGSVRSISVNSSQQYPPPLLVFASTSVARDFSEALISAAPDLLISSRFI